MAEAEVGERKLMTLPPDHKGEGSEGDPSGAEPIDIGTELARERARGKGGGSGGGDVSLEGRVSRLEAYIEVSRDDLKEIKNDLKAVIARLGTVPTKSDLDNWKWQWLLASVAIFAVVIGSIIGGLAWLDR